MCRISEIITFLESLRQAGWFDLFESDIQALLIFDPLITLWGNFDAPYLKLLNDASVASACFYVRTCRRVRNSKKIATIRDFHLPGSFLCLSTRLVRGASAAFYRTKWKITISTSCVHMGRDKITILIENKINNHQIYVPVFYLIEINITIAFWGQKWWNFMIVSPAASPPHASKCTVWVRPKEENI